MGNRKTTSSSTNVHQEKAQSSKSKGFEVFQHKDDVSCILHSLEHVEELISFLKNQKQVKKLSLDFCFPFSECALFFLFNSSISDCLGDLSALSIPGTYTGYKMRHEDIRLLCESINFKNLVELNLKNQHILDDGLKYLTNYDILNNITELDLSINGFGDEGMKTLSSCGKLKNLECLILAHNRISDVGLQYLSESYSIKRLNKLDLNGNNQVGDEGIKALSNSKISESLKSLSITGTEVSYDGIEAICNSPYLKLEELTLGSEAVDLKGNDNIDIRCISLLAKHHIEYYTNYESNEDEYLTFVNFRDHFIDRYSYRMETERVCNIRHNIYYWFTHRDSLDEIILNEGNATKMLHEIARDDPEDLSIRYLINNYNKFGYRFLINSLDEEGNSLSSLYDRYMKMQRFLFKNGMVPISCYLQDILVPNDDIIISLIDQLSKEIVCYVEENIELSEALKDLISGSLDVTKPELITFYQQKLLSKINREILSRIRYYSACTPPNRYDYHDGYSDNMKSMMSKEKYISFIIGLRNKMRNSQEYESYSS